MRHLHLVALALVALGFVPALAGASASDTAAVDVLPDATMLGDGWTLYSTSPSTRPNPSIRDSALRIYGGPRGARVVVTVYRAWDNMSSRLHVWLSGNDLFEHYRADISVADMSQESDLEKAAPPIGCSDARRTYGDETLGFSMFPVGLTLCLAANSDVVLMVFTSGEVAGKTGVDASDAVTELTLRLFDNAMKATQETS